MTPLLPSLAVWKARSFWAQLLMVTTVALNARGLDLMGLFQDMGLGDNPEQVIDSGLALWQQVSPLVFGFWAWWERRSPNFRLVWPWQDTGKLGDIGVSSPGSAKAEAPNVLSRLNDLRRLAMR